MIGPAPAPWLEDDDPFARAAGADAGRAGFDGAARLRELAVVTAHGLAVLGAGVGLALGARRLGGGEPVRTAALVALAASGWTWLGAGWARASLARAVAHLLGARPPGERRVPAEAAAALGATLPIVLLLPAGVVAGLASPAASGHPLAVAGAGLLLAFLLVAGLLLPIGACGLVLAYDLPPLAALVLVVRGLRRGAHALGGVLLAQALVVTIVAILTALMPFALLVWPVWLVGQGTAGSIALLALALGWARGLGADGPVTPVWVSRPPPPPAWLVPAALLLLNVAFGATLALGPVAAAVSGLRLPAGAFGVAAGVIAAPYLAGAALLRHQLAHHRRVALDEAGLLLDAGPAWVGTRVPWSDVRGARVKHDGVALALRWSELLVRLPADEIDPLLQWLAGRGVRRSDA